MSAAADGGGRPLVWFEGAVRPWEAARVHVFTPTVKYGASVFEGIRGYWNDDTRALYVFRLREHLQRLEYSQRMLRMAPLIDAAAVEDALLQLLRANAFEETVHIRPTVYVGGEGEAGAAGPTALSITAVPRPMPEKVRSGVRAQVSAWRRVADQAMPMRAKTAANYGNSRMAVTQARTDGYDAAIMLNQAGKVSEGPSMCLFMIRDGVAITPDVTSDILESITRDTLLALFREDLGVAVAERSVDRSELLAADELFFCGTGWEVTPICEVDGLTVGDGTPGPITRALQARYFDVVHGRVNERRDWLTAV